jgi:hypothetical protein
LGAWSADASSGPHTDSPTFFTETSWPVADEGSGGGWWRIVF